jgi:membrane protein
VTVLLISALILVVFGPAIGSALADHVGLGDAFRWTWNILQWPVLLVFVLSAFGLVYYFAPDVQQRFRFVTPGSITALVGWLAFSLLFSLYVNNFGSYNKTYGALAGLAVFLLYTYYSAFILLVGAEINQVIEQHAPEGKNEGEKTPNDQNGDGEKHAAHHSTLEILRENRLDNGSQMELARESRPRRR